MNYKKIALFFLVLFSYNQILPMEKAGAWFFTIFAAIGAMIVGCAIGPGVAFFIIAIKEKIEEKRNNFLRFDFYKTELKKDQINRYTEEFKTACLKKDMKTLKILLEQNYYILRDKLRYRFTLSSLVEILENPDYCTYQTPFFIACNEKNEDFLSSLTLKANDSADFFKINDYAKLFLAIAIENNQEKAIELLLRYSTLSEGKININWKSCTNNAIIKLLLHYQFNNINLKNAWRFDNLNKNKELANIILDSLQYLTNKDQQLDLYMRAIINGDSEISNKLAALYAINLNSSYKDDKAITGYQKLLFIYLIMREKNEQNYNDYWAFNDITIAKNNIEDIFSNQINNQNDKVALMDYLPEVCSRNELAMAKILLNFNVAILNSQTLFNIALDQHSDSTIEIINLLLDDSRITSFECKSSEPKRNQNNQTFFYSFYEKHFKQKNIESLNEINYIQRKISDKKFINSELQSAATILFNDSDVYKSIYIGASPLNLNCFTDYINFCLANGGDLTKRDKNKKLPLDYAHEQYDGSFKYMSVNSTQFWIKENIYHIFLSKTPCIQEKELCSLLLDNNIPRDCVSLIMNYNFINNIDRYIAEAVNKQDNYYCNNWSKKKEIKKGIISKKREELKILLGVES